MRLQSVVRIRLETHPVSNRILFIFCFLNLNMGISGALGGSQKKFKKWRLFRATDYVSLMWPCFELSRIHGLFPYKVTSGPTIVASKPGYIFSTLMTTVNVIFTGIIMYQIDISGTLEYDSVPGQLQGNCYILLGWTVAMVSYINSAKRMKLLSDLADVSARLPASSYTRMTRLVHAKDILGFLFLVGQAPNIYSTNLPLVLGKILDMYTTLVVYLMDTLYVDCVCVLSACFERINENLLALKESIETEEPHLLRRVYHEQKNPLILMEIRALKKQHNDVSEVVQRLNSVFSLQLVATVTLTFAEITFSLYFYILQLIGSEEINLEKQIWYCYFITSVTYYAVKLASIIWACETAKGQALRTGILVHEVLVDTTDKQVKEEVREWLDGVV